VLTIRCIAKSFINFRSAWLSRADRAERGARRPVRVEYLTCSAVARRKRRRNAKRSCLNSSASVSLLLRLFPDLFEPRSLSILRFTDDDLVLSATSAMCRFNHDKLARRPTRNEFTISRSAVPVTSICSMALLFSKPRKCRGQQNFAAF